MGRQTVRSARGDLVDFDTISIKQQLAKAPMNIEVARRKDFIDSKEGKARGAQRPASLPQPTPEEIADAVAQIKAGTTVPEDFLDNQPVTKSAPPEIVPVLPERKK